MADTPVDTYSDGPKASRTGQKQPRLVWDALVRRGSDLWEVQGGAVRTAGVVGILLVSFWAGMAPHWDSPYPLHVDEWKHIAYTQAMLHAGGLVYPNPYAIVETGAPIAFHREMGFHLWLGFLKSVTGLSWTGLFRIAPGLLLATMAFFTYAFGRRMGFGWAAALFVALIPTSVRTLGPSFVVPVSGAMLFIPVTLLLLHRLGGESQGRHLLILVVLMVGGLFVHATIEAVITVIAVAYMATYVMEALIRRQLREGARLALTMGLRVLIPAAILALWIPTLARTIVAQSGIQEESVTGLLGPNTGFVQAFGPVAAVLAPVGLLLFILRGQYGLRSYVLPVATLSLLVFLFYLYPQHGLGPEKLYERGWSPLALFLAIFAGYGLAIYMRRIPAMAAAVAARLGSQATRPAMLLLWAAGVAILVVALGSGLVGNERRESYGNFYYMVNDQSYADFLWVGQHTTAGQVLAMTEPSVSWAYPPIAGPGKSVFGAVSSPMTNLNADVLRAIYSRRRPDLWLQLKRVSVLYTFSRELDSEKMFKVRPGVYLIPGAVEAN
jgi:hypothetical protein